MQLRQPLQQRPDPLAHYAAAAGSQYEKNYRDITAGSNGACGAVCTAGPGYDFVTGLGGPRANKLVRFLATL